MEKKMSKRKVKGNYLTFNTCKSLCSELCNKISKETTQQWSKSLLITLTSVIDHVTYYAGECKEKLSNSLLKIITRKRLDEVEVLGTERQTSLSMIRIIRTLFDIFISFYKDENSQKTRLRLKKSELVQKFEDHIERSSPYWKSLTQDSSIFEKVRMKILNLITVYFEGVKLSGSEEFTENSSLEKLLKFMFNEQHIQETLTQEIPNTTEEQEENLELHMKPLDFITMTFYFSKLLYMEKNKNPRGCSTYLKLIKTFAGIHPFVVSMGIPFEPRQDQNDDMSTSSSEDDDTSDIVSPLSMDPRLRKCCLMIELLIMNELKSVSSALFVKEILMFLLNFSSVSTSLDYCKDTIVSCIEVCKTSSNESTTRRNDSASRSFHISMCNMANIIKTRECSSKALAVILSYVELITVKMNEQFKKKGASQGSTSNRRTEIFNVSSTFSERARKNQHAHLILPGSIFVKIKECLSAGVKLVHGEYAEFGSTDSVTSKLDKIMTGLCNYVINSSIAFKKKIKKNLDRSTSALIIECSASFQSVFDTISNVMSLRGSISTAKNNMEVDLTKNYTKLEQAMEKMCFEIRELNRAYKNRNKKAKLQRLVIIEELTKYRLINEDMTTHNDEENEEATQKRKKAGSSSTSKRRKKNLVLRSKNKYIDHALCVEDEDYHDIHADLEDWIDDDNWEPAY
ncbi:hypothetical protein C9374_013111 [Naegleria lovaniensis]|uniref:FANCI solenoid 4 domain-containing protein n=1 Tax=Naegleria lovaniensis TaxID=51637 RepID=A0AA88KE09_NAELO|nr:uncharacterized protein C9374_013111 [Naegleria lovaniensis]KAG2372831.1 hypothetical protein C9374_013111 [Naegleria lovaniensis]